MRSPQALSAGPAPSCAAAGRGRAAHTVITPPRGVCLRASYALERARLRHERCHRLRRPRKPKGAQPISARAQRRLDRAPDRARRGRAARVRPLPIGTVASPPSLGHPDGHSRLVPVPELHHCTLQVHHRHHRAARRPSYGESPVPAAQAHELTLVLCSRPARVRVHSSSIPRVTARHRLPCRSMTRVGGENGQTRRYGVDPRGRTIVT